MSNKAINWAKAQTTGSLAAKAVLLVLADYADDDAKCYPSHVTIAKITEQSERNVRRQMPALEKRRLIKRELRRDSKGRRTSDMVYLLIPGFGGVSARADSSSGRCESDRTNKPEPAGQNRPDQPDNVSGNPLDEPSEDPHMSEIKSAFEQGWETYAHPASGDPKEAARKAWTAAISRGADPARILNAVKAQAAWVRDGEGRLPCQMAKWLGQSRFESMPAYKQIEPTTPTRKLGKVDPAHANVWARFRADVVNRYTEGFAVSWIDPLGFDGATVRVPSRFFLNYLEPRIGDLITDRRWNMRTQPSSTRNRS